MNTTADRLKYAMELRNIRQSELAELTKISKGALSSYLKGTYVPKQNNIYLLADALQVNPSWLIGADTSMEIDPSPDPDDLMELREELRRNPAKRILFDVTKNATEEEILTTVRLFEALMKNQKQD